MEPVALSSQSSRRQSPQGKALVKPYKETKAQGLENRVVLCCSIPFLVCESKQPAK